VSDTGKKETLSLARDPRTLGLKKTVETGQVKQSFSHGRTKTVQVEVRKTRTVRRAGEPEVAPPPPPVARKPEPAASPPPPPPPVPVEAKAEPRVRHVLPTLSDAEKLARARALDDARKADVDARKRAEESAVKRAADEARKATEREAAERRRLEEDERKKHEEEARRRAEDEAERRQREQDEKARRDSGEEPLPVAAAAPAAPSPVVAAPVPRPATAAEAEPARVIGLKRPRTPVKPPPAAPRARTEERRGGRMTVTQALSDNDERMRSLASVRRARERQRQLRAQAQAAGETLKIVRDVVIPEAITVQELANRMAEKATDVIRSLMKLGVMATITQAIDADTAEVIVQEYGHRSKRVSAADVEIGLGGAEDTEGEAVSRPPVVTVMGHVDHGKTSLLDAIRQADVAAGEAGGITQHIGAYQVETADGGKITFIDTPGHEAFTAMRARGAKVTDIVVLVVAADDGVMPQTVEAINHAKAAGAPIIVAINKMDRPDANPMRVKQGLLQHDVQPEDMGGDVQVIEVSAVKKTNIDGLLEAILLQSEVLELKANPNREAQGVVIEAKLDRGRGPVATVLVQRGTLRVGEVFVAGSEWGRVRALVDSQGRPVESAGPSTPVEVLGLSGAPMAGDEFVVVPDEARAREVTAYRQRTERDKRASGSTRGTLEALLKRRRDGEPKVLPAVVKGDVQGSIEAIVGAVERLGTEEVAVRVIHSGVGAITESDVTLAKASGAMIIGFNVRANAQARDLAKRDGIEIRYYSIIYELVDELKAALSGMLSPRIEQTVIGHVEVLQVFDITKVGKIAGCKVTSGIVKRSARVRLLRDSVVIHDGAIRTLRRFKDDVREVREGNECGIALENYQDLRAGDALEIYEVQEVQRAL